MKKDIGKEGKILVSLDLSAIKNNRSIGVSDPSMIFGLSSLEAKEIALVCGGEENIELEIAEYNPGVEKFTTGCLAHSIFYNFLIGVGKRLEQNKN
jgi:hypothetical protein